MIEPLGNRPKITINNIRQGYITRYFIRHISSRDILEIDEYQYKIFVSNRSYETFSLKWFITGNDAVTKNTSTIQLYTNPTNNITQNTIIMSNGLRAVLRPNQYVVSNT